MPAVGIEPAVDGPFWIARPVHAGPLPVPDDHAFATSIPWYEAPSPARCRARSAEPGVDEELARCGDPADSVRFSDPSVPARLVVLWALAAAERAPVPAGLLERAVEDVDEHAGGVSLWLGVACETDRPDLADAIVSIITREPALAVACPHQSDPRVARAWAAACRGRCAVTPDALVDPRAAIREGAWIPGLLARHPAHRSALLAAAERCALDRDPRAAHCLASLAEADWERARGVAERMAPASEPALAAVQGALRRFDGSATMQAHLSGLGFALGDRVRRDGDPLGSVEALLDAHGLALHADEYAGAGSFAAALAERTGALDGVRFELVSPPVDTWGGLASLRAWTGDRRAHVVFEPGGEVVAAVSLVNALLVGRDADARVAVSADAPDRAVWGPASALRSLHDARLLPLAAPEEHWPVLR